MPDYIAWDPSLPYPGVDTGDPASDALSRGVPPGYVAQLYGPAFPAPAGVAPLTRVPDNIAVLIGGGGPYYAIGAGLAQHFEDESNIVTVLPPSGPNWALIAMIGVGVLALAMLAPNTLVINRR